MTSHDQDTDLRCFTITDKFLMNDVTVMVDEDGISLMQGNEFNEGSVLLSWGQVSGLLDIINMTSEN